VDRVTGTNMFPDPPEPPQLVQMAAQGPWAGPRVRPGGHVFSLFMPEHPLHGRNFGLVGTVTSLVDLWADTGRLPSYMRQGAKRPA
jgi:hypothetical protein